MIRVIKMIYVLDFKGFNHFIFLEQFYFGYNFFMLNDQLIHSYTQIKSIHLLQISLIQKHILQPPY